MKSSSVLCDSAGKGDGVLYNSQNSLWELSKKILREKPEIFAWQTFGDHSVVVVASV